MGRRRKRVYGLMIALLVLTLVAIVLLQPGIFTQGQSRPPAAPGTNDSPNSAIPPVPGPPYSPPGANSSIRIATFNIQIFGESKRSKPEVMEVLAKTARRYDIMAIQELRDDTETTLPIYLGRINAAPGPEYAAVSSPRLGRTSSKENYAFIYNTETVSLVAGSPSTFIDPPEGSSVDLFQREPFMARFKSKGGSSFDFALITIHTDPDTTPQELMDLPLALESARGRYYNETDFILLGDMNADCSYLPASDASALTLRNSSFLWVVPDDADTTVKSSDCAYDRIILSGTAPSHYTGNWSVFRFDDEYRLNQSEAEGVSDHYPVWIELAGAG